MENFEIFEEAGKYILDKMSEFKDALSTKVSSLEGAEWSFDKGSVKACKADETGRKPRCKVGVKYHLKVQLSVEDVEAIWNEFNLVFKESHIADIERIRGNEELLRYEFKAKNPKGDEVSCSIYLPSEWNISQIGILGFVSPRYKKADYVE